MTNSEKFEEVFGFSIRHAAELGESWWGAQYVKPLSVSNVFDKEHPCWFDDAQGYTHYGSTPDVMYRLFE